MEKERIRKEEEEYIESLDFFSKFIYISIYSKCCKSSRKGKFDFKLKEY